MTSENHRMTQPTSATDRTPATSQSPPTVSPSAVPAAEKQQLRQRLLEMILKREAERRTPPRAAG